MNNTKTNTQKIGKKESFSSIKKKQSKPLSKKKQKSLSKSAKVMIEKMNVNTTDDDIMNIMMSMETKTDTKALGDDNESDEAKELQKRQGLRSLDTKQLKTDQRKDEHVAEKEKKVQSAIAEQLKMINEFTL